MTIHQCPNCGEDFVVKEELRRHLQGKIVNGEPSDCKHEGYDADVQYRKTDSSGNWVKARIFV